MKKTNLVLGFLLIFLLAMSTSLIAVDYVVSGAGTPEVNGTYVENGTVEGYPAYQLGSTIYWISYYDYYWQITDTDDEYCWYYIESEDTTPPLTVWEAYDGDSPDATIAVAGPSISYSSAVFPESFANNGTIDNSTPITITHNNFNSETFTGTNGEDFVNIGKVTVTNFPTGLTVIISRTNSTTLSVTITGTADSHNNTDDVTDLTFTFHNSAFSSGDAAATGNSTKSDLEIDFVQHFDVAASGGDYTTIAAAIAASDGRDVINVAAGTYTEAELIIDKSLTIIGQGAELTIVQAHETAGSATHRVFDIDEGYGNGSSWVMDVSIQNMTIRHGVSPTYEEGGGVLIGYANSVAFLNVNISNNVMNTPNGYGRSGGGICSNNYISELILENCTISDNTITGDNATGSALYTINATSILNCTITGNTSETLMGEVRFGDGGNDVNLIMTNSTISGNSSGIAMNLSFFFYPKNSIFSGNGVFDYNVGNYSNMNDLGYNIVGVQSTSGSPTNWRFDSATSILYNYMADGTASTSWNRNNIELANQNLNLSDTLADNDTDNGTQTLALLSGSFAIDAGTDSGAPATDQRGFSRVGITDIGAYEYSAGDPPVPVNLSSFYALYTGSSPTLYWTTQTEENNAYWNVYRGTTDNFENSVNVNANDHVPGNGTTNLPSEYVFVDTTPIVQNATYWYWIEDISTDGEIELHEPITLFIPFEDTPILPETYGLQQNYPNPFNPSTAISFTLEEDSNVELAIYNVKGARIRTLFNDNVHADQVNTVIWDGNDADGKKVSSGVYFYKLNTKTRVSSKKMLLVK